MIDNFTTAPAPVDNSAAVIAMSRLADRLAAVARPQRRRALLRHSRPAAGKSRSTASSAS